MGVAMGNGQVCTLPRVQPDPRIGEQVSRDLLRKSTLRVDYNGSYWCVPRDRIICLVDNGHKAHCHRLMSPRQGATDR